MSNNVAALFEPLNADDLVASIRMLPPLPDVAREILDRLGDEFIDGNEIADIVARDPAISARLFALSNSAYFGLAKPVDDMREVVNRVLGPDTVRSLAFALASERTFDLGDCESFDARRFWHRALSTAAAAKRIAAVVDDLSDAERGFAYVAGLCHSLGLLVLACCHPAETSLMLETYAGVDDEDFDVVAKEQFGLSVSEVSHTLAEHWKMPEVIVDAYQYRASGNAAGNLLTATINAAIKSAKHMEQLQQSEDEESNETDSPSFDEELPVIGVATITRVALPSDKEQQATQSTLNAMLGD